MFSDRRKHKRKLETQKKLKIHNVDDCIEGNYMIFDLRVRNIGIDTLYTTELFFTNNNNELFLSEDEKKKENNLVSRCSWANLII